MPRIDIVLPVYNPLPGWEGIVIQRYRSLCGRLADVDFSLTVVNDGSSRLDAVSKETLQAQLPQIQWIEYEVNRGKGYALRKGIQHTSGDWIVFTDIDWPYTEDSMVRLIQTMLDGADVAIGVRDQDYYKHLPPMRMRISKWLRAFNARLLKLKVNDTQAGLKGFHSLYKPIFMKTTIDRYLFDLEFIYRLSKIREINMVSVPIKLREGITFSTMNRKILLQETMNFLKVLVSR
jgi:glycosyltransferase involved in cell wall biosynthesis